jgi:hypothetical protein
MAAPSTGNCNDARRFLRQFPAGLPLRNLCFQITVDTAACVGRAGMREQGNGGTPAAEKTINSYGLLKLSG